MDDSKVIAALGLPTQMEPVYRRIQAGSGRTVEEVAASLLLTREQLLAQLTPLLALDIVTIEDGVLHVIDPATATSRALVAQADELGVKARELRRIAEVLPVLAERRETSYADDEHIDGDVSSQADIPALIAQWILEKRGDPCFLRPDQWRLPSESEMAVAVGNSVRDGRPVRAIYPARAMSEAPHMLQMRAEIGEEIRVLPSVLTRMVIVGPRRAILPEPLGVGSERRVVVRQASIVGVLQAWFEELWESASRVDARGDRLHERDHRRLLLAELADGVKDEQIARNLDVSLRTVRRRVASLMVELGVDTRFQAGVEAVRRGWL